MAAELTFAVIERDGRETPLRVAPRRVLIAGYTGRDQAKVREHVRELAHLGVAPPPRVPMLYAVGPELLTQAAAIEVRGAQTSGEAEFCLVVRPDGLLVGVGSDHTDRRHEAIDVAESKALCPKPLGRALWRHEDVRPHWDRIDIRSWTTGADERRLYQTGQLDAFLPVDALLAALREAGHDPLGCVVYGGTLPTLGDLEYGRRFEAELYDPILDRSLTCRYDVRVMEP